MNLAVCIDDKNGMMFNKRRQSRDKAQQADLLAWCAGRTLWMGSYSAPLFEGAEAHVDDGFLEKAGEGEVCFVEDRSVKDVADRVEAVVLYRWNRTYPADLRFDLDISAFYLDSTVEFSGTSHETITREIYQRKENNHG